MGTEVEEGGLVKAMILFSHNSFFTHFLVVFYHFSKLILLFYCK